MDIMGEVLTELEHEDKQQLRNMSRSILTHFTQHGKLAWQSLDDLVKNLSKNLNYFRIIKNMSFPLNYHRISLSPPSEKIDVVLFIFKIVESPGGAILIHTYDSHNPNKIIFNPCLVENPTDLTHNHVVIQTPIHNHQAICHSYVAWLEGHITVWEQLYKLKNDGRLQLLGNWRRVLHECGLENSMGELIHSVTIDFGSLTKGGSITS